MDYWGVSLLHGLEYIVENYPAPLYKIVESSNSLKYNASLFKPEDRQIYFCYPNEDPDFLVLEGKQPEDGYPGTTLIYHIDIGNARLVSAAINTINHKVLLARHSALMIESE